MTDIDYDVPAAAAWSARAGACLRSAFPGTSVSGIGAATGPVGRGLVGMVRPVTHVRPRTAAVSLVGTVMAPDGQTNNSIQMTSVFVSGEGASGSPPDREPA